MDEIIEMVLIDGRNHGNPDRRNRINEDLPEEVDDVDRMLILRVEREIRRNREGNRAILDAVQEEEFPPVVMGYLHDPQKKERPGNLHLYESMAIIFMIVLIITLLIYAWGMS